MRGLQIVHWGEPYVLNTSIPVPSPAKGQLLIKIASAGYCHTETLVLNGDFARLALRDPLPQIPSHEPTGWVAAVGEGVDGEKWKVGMRVGCLNYRDMCGSCKECKAGDLKFCTHANLAGVTADGAFAEYMLASPQSTIPLPASISFDNAAPLFCAGATVYCGLLRCALSPGQAVAILGCGALGHLGVQFAKVMGLRVVAIDSRQAPLDLCATLSHPLDKCINSSLTPVNDALAKLPFEVDAAVVATDAIPAYRYALELTRKHGTVVVLGQPKEDIPVPYFQLIMRDLTIKGSVLSSPEDCQDMINMFAEHNLEVRTHVYKMEEISKLIEDTHKPEMSGKMVVRIAEEF
ncbi:zinc binding dehydrogenase [Dacryopinax primogenitus]|uniref:Zinc binding dehydrogenase n=1 Tax=Dacryopinax primogenitus (strain DJM 731) TaxID=1858805 RepID=M5G9L1_DACPD|nr:zinc binding dehydrogenase [Dacryopinax primogenitus]EJU02552.1 zinc binding dehydrogenase [Dacryopinax primogenitus]